MLFFIDGTLKTTTALPAGYKMNQSTLPIQLGTQMGTWNLEGDYGSVRISNTARYGASFATGTLINDSKTLFFADNSDARFWDISNRPQNITGDKAQTLFQGAPWS